ncbi:MAG: hypothetical protein QHH07_12090 [Sedimentisphaerales bacterium]|jgi:hypothetical protein|nr:hypothetical protein [Sedimentisphaerales bacterium]
MRTKPRRGGLGLAIIVGALILGSPFRASCASTETVTIENLIATGYYIRLSVDPIRVKQDLTSQSPYTTYYGCTTVDVISSFAARFAVKVRPTSPAGGTWTATVRPAGLPKGRSKTRICVRGQAVDQSVLVAGSKVKVAEVTVIVMPN